MKKIPDFDIELAQAMDYIMDSELTKKAFSNPPFLNYANILRYLLQNIDRLADNCHMPEFTNHAMPHVCSIVRRATEWAEKDGWIDRITAQEAGYLVIALVIHDIGMLSQDASDIPIKNKMQYVKGFSDISNWVRRTHVIRVRGLVEKLLKDSFIKKDNSIQKHLNIIISMAESHQRWPWEEGFVACEKDILELGLEKERLAALNAIIAVSDLLDEDSERCDTITLIKHRHGTMENMAHWIRHALTVEVDGVKNHTVTVRFRKLIPSQKDHEQIYRALRNHYRLVKLYNNVLENLGATIDHLVFYPNDGIPDFEDKISKELGECWIQFPEFKNSITEQLLGTFMPEARNETGQNSDLRIVLNRVGLEGIDTSDMNYFLKPDTVCFPEEKIILGKGPFIERLYYAKDLVQNAYLNGQMGKVRHLCNLIFAEWKETVHLNDIYWVYVFYSVSKRYGDENYQLNCNYNNSLNSFSGMEKSNRLIIEGEYQYLLDVLLMMQEPINSEEWIVKYKEHIQKCNFKYLDDNLETSLLLENIIGLFWYYDNEKIVWREVAELIVEKLKVHVHGLANTVLEYYEQLLVQTQILFQKNECKNNVANYIESDSLSKAWKDFWDGNWSEIEKDIPHLVQKAENEHDYLCPVQGFINIVGNLLLFEKYETNQSIYTDLRIGRSRYNRIIMEQPLPIYWAQRALQIDSLIAECMEKPRESSNSMLSAIRLIELQEMDALRFWNLGEYMHALRNEVKIFYLKATYVNKYGEYRGNEGDLLLCLIGYIKSLDEKVLTQQQLKLVCKLICKYSPKAIDEVINYIVKRSKEIEWKYALKLLNELTPYTDKNQKSILLDWIVQYDKYYRKQNYYFDIKQYVFLKDWLPQFDISDWDKVKVIIDKIFAQEHVFISNQELCLQVLIYSPWDVALKYLQDMDKFPHSEMKRKYISEAIIDMSKRVDVQKEELHKFMSNCLIQDECEVYKKVDSLIDITTLHELGAVDTNKVKYEIERLKKEIQERGNLCGYSSQLLRPIIVQCTNQNWSAADENEVIRIIDEIFEIMNLFQESMSRMFFSDFCMLLGEICRMGTVREREYINSYIVNVFMNQSFLKDAETFYDGPLSSIRIDRGTHNLYEIRVMYLLVQGMTNIIEDEKERCIDWCIKVLSFNEAILFQYAVVLFSYFYFMSKNKRIVRKAWSGLMFIRGRVIGEDEKTEKIREEVLKAINAMEDAENWFGRKKYLERVEKSEEYKEMFYSIRVV